MDAETTRWQTLAAAWELAALSLYMPAGVLAYAVASGEWVDAAAEIAGRLGAGRPELDAALHGLQEDTEGADADGLVHVLRAEHTRLFVGVPDPAVSPYEGIWRAHDEDVQALLFVNPHSMEVERFMRSCGLGRPEGTNEPLDFAATECELMEHLALLASGATPPGDAPEEACFPGGSYRAAYRLFADEHVATWMPCFAADVVESARHPFYRAAACFLEALLECA